MTVINRHNAKHPVEIYQYLKRIGSTYIQFIPLVERKGAQPTKEGLYLVTPEHNDAHVTKWSVLPQDYGHFLATIYDEWINKDVGTVYVQMFETVMSTIVITLSTLNTN